MGMFGMMYHALFHCDDPVDELWLYHRASSTIIGGENLGWMYPRDALRAQPFMIRQMVKPDAVYIMTMPRRVSDAEAIATCWQRVLAWDARTLMTYHDPPGHAFVGDARAALTNAARAVKQLRA